LRDRVASSLFRSCEISLRNSLVIPPPTELRRIAQSVVPSTCKRHRRACNASKRSMSAVRALAFRARDNCTRRPDCADFGGPLQVGVPIAQRADRLRISRPARRYAAVAFCSRALLFEDRRLRAPASDWSEGPGLLRHFTHHNDSPSEAFTALEDGNVFPHRSHTTPHRRVARPRR
jgi:hypothetical protein